MTDTPYEQMTEEDRRAEFARLVIDGSIQLEPEDEAWSHLTADEEAQAQAAAEDRAAGRPTQPAKKYVVAPAIARAIEAQKAKDAEQQAAAMRQSVLDAATSPQPDVFDWGAERPKVDQEGASALLELGLKVNADALATMAESFEELDDAGLHAALVEAQVEAVAIGTRPIPRAGSMPEVYDWNDPYADVAAHTEATDTVAAKVALIQAEVDRRAGVALKAEHPDEDLTTRLPEVHDWSGTAPAEEDVAAKATGPRPETYDWTDPAPPLPVTVPTDDEHGAPMDLWNEGNDA